MHSPNRGVPTGTGGQLLADGGVVGTIDVPGAGTAGTPERYPF
jgi:hypothetical protein